MTGSAALSSYKQVNSANRGARREIVSVSVGAQNYSFDEAGVDSDGSFIGNRQAGALIERRGMTEGTPSRRPNTETNPTPPSFPPPDILPRPRRR